MCILTIEIQTCGIHASTSHLQLCTIRATTPGSEDLPPSTCPHFKRSAIPSSSITNTAHPPCAACSTHRLAADGHFSPTTNKWKSVLEYTDTHGGASCEHTTGAILTSPSFQGFMVGGVVPNNSSPAPRWSRDKSSIPNAVTAIDIEEFITTHHAIFNSHANPQKKLVLGLWISPATDELGNVVYDARGNTRERLYLDVSEAFTSQFRAVAASLSRRELGMFMITDDYKDGFRVCTGPGSRVERALRGAMREENEEIVVAGLRSLKLEGEGPWSVMRSPETTGWSRRELFLREKEVEKGENSEEGLAREERGGGGGGGRLGSIISANNTKANFSGPQFPRTPISGPLNPQTSPSQEPWRSGTKKKKTGSRKPPILIGKKTKRKFARSVGDTGEFANRQETEKSELSENCGRMRDDRELVKVAG